MNFSLSAITKKTVERKEKKAGQQELTHNDRRREQIVEIHTTALDIQKRPKNVSKVSSM